MPMFTFPMIFIAISSFYVLQLKLNYGIIAALVLLLIGVACDIVITMFFPPYLVISGFVVAFMIFAIIILIPWPFLIFAFIGQGSLIDGTKAVIKAPVNLSKKGYEYVKSF
jgi:hypothetical protein